ncbi:glycosyltransferase [Parabacteroides sp. 52]|uniref:glycosyltransferase n=1 Tax=unclassified Parabacteroides TaxID=2649774 RepID=UPI0013D70627|nr:MULTISPECIES: glycosyltransferase [unclassified Parabacteroides]MDH6533772.1 glycosyltransferase involved in cell wall biosynthesis [Parabacteroides sp. PM5-20]NDV54522.1 glycosyltransferase [Parabacteroides sp. 52]
MKISDNPILSIVLPVYNMERFVGDAINSILNQAFYDFELILIDDASTDNSLNRIQSFKDNRIRIFCNKQNQGNYPSRNLGAQKARGKYIAVMDADDIALPDRLKQQFDYLEEHPDLLAVGCQFDFIGLNYKKENPLGYEDVCAGLLQDNCVLHPSLLIRAEAFRQLNGYNEIYRYASDYDLLCRLSLLGKIENLPGCYMSYRWHEDQISQKQLLQQKEYANQIRQNYQITYINSHKWKVIDHITTNETGHARMGEVIGLYVMSKKYPDKDFEDRADKLLDEIFNNISYSTPVCIKNGLLGIGCGLIWLLRNGFVEGDEDEVLGEIDSHVLYTINYKREKDTINWAGLFYYLRRRISKVGRQLSLLKNKQSMLYLLDCYERHMQFMSIIVHEPGVHAELEALLQMHLFENKVQKLLSPSKKTKPVYPKIETGDDPLVTFIIPVRIDSEERLQNLSVVVDYLSVIDKSRIIILEGDGKSRITEKNSARNIQYYFIEDPGKVFHRTQYINLLLQMVETPIVGVWDTDVILPVEQIESSIREIKEGKAAISFPYDGRFYDVSPPISQSFREERSMKLLEEAEREMTLKLSFGTYSVGGAFLVKKEVYLNCGGENEAFYGWGAEDMERVKRMEAFGHPIHRTEGALFHLSHPRVNSHYIDKNTQLKSLQELIKIINLSEKEIQEYIATWEWGLFPAFV